MSVICPLDLSYSRSLLIATMPSVIFLLYYFPFLINVSYFSIKQPLVIAQGREGYSFTVPLLSMKSALKYSGHGLNMEKFLPLPAGSHRYFSDKLSEADESLRRRRPLLSPWQLKRN